jgi:uncharacterized protein (TIGR00369 family)
MNQASREARRTAKLRQILPLYDFIELTVDSLDSEARCSVPLSVSNRNHFGAMHAGILFSLAEVTAGCVFSMHKALSGRLVIAKNVEIRYLRPAMSAVYAIASLSEEVAREIQTAIEQDVKIDCRVPVTLFNDANEIVAEAVGIFVLRAT